MFVLMQLKSFVGGGGIFVADVVIAVDVAGVVVAVDVAGIVVVVVDGDVVGVPVVHHEVCRCDLNRHNHKQTSLRLLSVFCRQIDK